jgi:hypothetical protein
MKLLSIPGVEVDVNQLKWTVNCKKFGTLAAIWLRRQVLWVVSLCGWTVPSRVTFHGYNLPLNMKIFLSFGTLETILPTTQFEIP